MPLTVKSDDQLFKTQTIDLCDFNMPSSQHFNPSHELKKAFLFLRTASTAVTNLKAQVESTKESTKPYSHWNETYRVHRDYEEALAVLEKDLKVWERRYAQAGRGLINWAVKVRTGSWLPAELVDIIEKMLYNKDLDLPGIW